MRVLHLTLKKKWFDMILTGEKKDEYREIKDYWARRLLDAVECDIEFLVWDEMICDMRHPFKRHNDVAGLAKYFGVEFRYYDAIKFRNGYAKNAPEFTIECKGIAVRTGREKWGAEKGKFYFALRLGRILEKLNC